uniref:Reverse transcriptase domain-containing protein n=1 Tax=Macaca mulatta TaxID=9544 RepID=A0A5F7ZBW9_MACMU
DTSTPSLATDQSPLTIPLKPNHPYPAQCQYPIPQHALKGLKPVITHLLQHGLLKPINSPYNSPILTVLKPDRSYRLVQDLHLINQIVLPIHPVVPNPYTLLSSIPPSTTSPQPSILEVLDFKHAFFTISLYPSSQPLFAFTWIDPDTHQAQQITWAVLPQGFTDSPHYFSQAQISSSSVTYLGIILHENTSALPADRVRLISQTQTPSTKQQLLSFLGMVSYFHLWIPSFTILSKPLRKLPKANLADPIDPKSFRHSSFRSLKNSPRSCPHTGSP